MSHVLIVDDEPSICWGFREFLTEDGHDVAVASSAEEALRLSEGARFDAVVMDVRLPGMDGLTAIRELRKRIGEAPVIVITAFGNLETAVQAVREGAFDYLPKPFDLQQASDIVGRALQARHGDPVTREAGVEGPRDTLVGASPAMQQVFKQIALVAAADVPVLITGESGTGKELVARAIHRNSPRGEQPFVPICLAALSPGVVESELFGHVKGSFTGATADRRGLLELAGEGTVLLDEIADTTTALQVKLLRAIEEREVLPVGDAQARPIRARLVAATNRSIPDLIRAGEFREDLFFRLSVFQIHLPALRDRLDDIPLLAEHFLKLCQPTGLQCRTSHEFFAALRVRRWPGNVRELRNVIEHAAIVSRGGVLGPEHLPNESAATSSAGAARAESPDAALSEWIRIQSLAAAGSEGNGELHEQYLAVVEPPLLKAVLERCGHNRAAAAQLLGIHRATLRQKLRRYGLDEHPYRKA